MVLAKSIWKCEIDQCNVVASDRDKSEWMSKVLSQQVFLKLSNLLYIKMNHKILNLYFKITAFSQNLEIQGFTIKGVITVNYYYKLELI